MPYFSHPVTPPEPEIHIPSTSSDREDDGHIQESHSPSLPADNLVEGAPGPAPGSTINDLNQDDFQDDELDRDITHLGVFNEGLLFNYSDDEDVSPVQSRGDEDEGDTPPASDDEDDPHITLEHMKTNLQFVRMVEEATLKSQFTAAELRAFRNPQELQASPSDDPDLKLSISFYISSLDHASSERAYAASRRNILERYPDSNMLSYDQVKRRVSNLSGLTTWKNHMCVDSCVGFTGPYEKLEACPHCNKPRYDQDKLEKSNGKNKVPQKEFATFAFGPQLQARWASPEMAQEMFYRRDKTQEELDHVRGPDYIYDDIFCGSDYLDAVEDGRIASDYDTVAMLSIDGCTVISQQKVGLLDLHLDNLGSHTQQALQNTQYRSWRRHSWSRKAQVPRLLPLPRFSTRLSDPEGRPTPLGWLQSHGSTLAHLCSPRSCGCCGYGRSKWVCWPPWQQRVPVTLRAGWAK